MASKRGRLLGEIGVGLRPSVASPPQLSSRLAWLALTIGSAATAARWCRARQRAGDAGVLALGVVLRRQLETGQRW
jgi:hypothetical protein